MSSLHTDSERALATMGLEMVSGSDLRVLIGGLGLGYTAHEVLKDDRVKHVEVVEFLPEVISWLDRNLIPLGAELKSEERLTIVQGDVYARLSEAPVSMFDLVLIDVDHSPDEHLNGANSWFYTEEGLRAVVRHISDSGGLGVWSFAESNDFRSALEKVFSTVSVAPVSFENKHSNEVTTDWLFLAGRQDSKTRSEL